MNDDYLAGFIDGEGCLSLTKIPRKNRVNRTYYRAVLHIGSTDRAILEEIQCYLGVGSLADMQKPKGNRKQAYQLQIAGSIQLLPILIRLEPKLIVKKRQAQILIEFLSGTVPRGERHIILDEQESIRRDGLIQQIRVLNKRGVSPWL